MQSNKCERGFFDSLRAVAIFSVVCAHTATSNNIDGLSGMCVKLLQIIGCGGVGIFFILAGYFFWGGFRARVINRFLEEEIS